MLEAFLSKLGASTRITIGVSISPSVGLEMAEIDPLTNTVSKYSHRPLEYNHSSRDIVDYDEFEASLGELFDELNIPPRSNIILSVPNVHFGMINLPLLLTDEAITNAIISEVEQSYIFKRQEPVVSWAEVSSNTDTENRTLAYTAIQKDTLDKILEACDHVGCKLTGIENSYASLLKALHASDLTKEQMKENITWNLMVVGQNNYAIISMLGKKIMEYYEEPLALKSFVNDEIYNAITISAQLTLSGLPANYLFIVSETDLVSAEVLSMKISAEGTINFLECNKFTPNELLPANLNILPKRALQITPEVIGATVYPFSDYPLKLNMIQEKLSDSNSLEEDLESPRINIGNLEIELTPDFIKRLALIVSAIFILPILVLSFFIGKVVVPKEQTKLDGINTKIEQVNKDIAKYNDTEKNNTFDIKSTIDKILQQNKTKLSYYSALGVSIPSKLWITYYVMNGGGRVDIKGEAKDVKNVYIFYKSLKQLVNNSNIRLYKLEIPSDSIDDIVANSSPSKTYEFEITNMTEDELNPPDASNKSGDATQQSGQNQDDKKSIFSIFGSNNKAAPSASNSSSAPASDTSQSASGASQASASGAQQAGSPPANSSSTPQNGQLPNNLQKIEKF